MPTVALSQPHTNTHTHTHPHTHIHTHTQTHTVRENYITKNETNNDEATKKIERGEKGKVNLRNM